MDAYKFLPLLLSSIAIIVSILSFLKTRKITLYQDIDRLYLEVLKLAMAEPRFIDRELTGDYKNKFAGEELHRYNAYAFIVWNVCETISDRIEEKTLFMKEKSLRETWEPVLRTENDLHRTWFDDPDNVDKFKKVFRDFVHDHYSLAKRS